MTPNQSSHFSVPGHVHLQTFGKVVKDAIRAAGGIPFESNTIGVDDGIVMGPEPNPTHRASAHGSPSAWGQAD